MLKNILSCFYSTPEKPEIVTIGDCKADFSTYKPYRYAKSGFRRYHWSNVAVRMSQKSKNIGSKAKSSDYPGVLPVFSNKEKRKKIERQRRSEIFRKQSFSTPTKRWSMSGRRQQAATNLRHSASRKNVVLSTGKPVYYGARQSD